MSRERVKKVFFLQFLILTSFVLFAENPNLKFIASSEYTGNPAWSPDGKYIASVKNGNIVFWNAKKDDSYEKTIFSSDTSPVISIEFSKDSKHLLIVKEDHSIIIYNIEKDFAENVIDGQNAENAIFYLGANGIILPFDERNLYEYFKLDGTQKFTLEERLRIGQKIVSLSVDDYSTKLMAATANEKAFLISVKKSNNWSVLSKFDYFYSLEIFPKISPNAKNVILPKSETEIELLFLGKIDKNENIKKLSIKESKKFTGDASFSFDSKYFAAGTESKINIYTVTNAKIFKTLYIPTGELLSKIVFAPDNSSVLFTTKSGKLYRWNFKTDNSDFIISDSFKTKGSSDLTNSDFQNKGTTFSGNAFKTKKGFFINTDFSLSTAPSPFILKTDFSLSFISYDWIKPFSLGFRIKPGLTFPKSDFPYNYSLRGEQISSPILINAGLLMPFGIFMMPFANNNLGFGAEIALGANFFSIWNKETGSDFHTSKIYTSFLAEAKISFCVKSFTLFLGASYDSILKFCVNGGFGFSFKVGSKK